MLDTLAAGSGASLIWCMRTPDALSWRVWGGDCVVFDPRSGSTHRLDILAAHALRLVAAGPTDAAALTAAIARFLEVDSDAELTALVDGLLRRLAQLGLIEAGQ